MNKQTAVNVFLPLPGGEQATYTNSTVRFRHYDWQGSARLESNMAEHEYGDLAYAPFGESYAILNTPYPSFTGQQQDTVPGSGLYDFLYREYSAVQGRWNSPDPAGFGAADPSNPQSWNRYAYVMNNPLAMTDALGLCSQRAGEYVCAGGNGGECILDGTPIACSFVIGNQGAFVNCGSFCDLIGYSHQYSVETETSNYSLIPTANGLTWINDTNGRELTAGAAAETGLPDPQSSDHVVAANNCQAPFLCNPVHQIGPPQQYRPAKQPSKLSNYAAFLGCEYNSVVETITDEEDGQGWTAYGFINAGAIISLRSGIGATPVGLVFVATAGAMDVGAMAKANRECTEQIYH